MTVSFKESQNIQRQHGKSYYFATAFFPKHIRQAVYALYGFVRVPDELIDNPRLDQDPKKSLAVFKKDWEAAYTKKQSADPILHAASYVFHRYKIPYSCSESFLKAMVQDISKSTYANYQQLKDYMYGSAAVVGIMMTHILGYHDRKAFRSAETLGYAMQLTNFLRDINEDYQQRHRIYLPHDEMKRFGISAEDIHHGHHSANWITFMQWQIARTRKLYDQAYKGIAYLPRRYRFAIKVAAKLYAEILTVIEEQHYNSFGPRAYVPTWRKIKILIKVMIYG